MLDKHSLFSEDRAWTIYNCLQCYSLASLREELDRYGFTIHEVVADTTGSVGHDEAPEITVIARPKTL